MIKVVTYTFSFSWIWCMPPPTFNSYPALYWTTSRIFLLFCAPSHVVLKVTTTGNRHKSGPCLEEVEVLFNWLRLTNFVLYNKKLIAITLYPDIELVTNKSIIFLVYFTFEPNWINKVKLERTDISTRLVGCHFY